MVDDKTTLSIPGFDVIEYLGSGARSSIWRVRHQRTGQDYALKRVFKKAGDDERFFQQAINEFEIARKFDHPAIRKYYKLRRIRNLFKTKELLLLMELCHGQSCQAKPPSDILQTVRIFRAVADALSYMHSKGYIHADIKPNNIIVADDGTVKIIDFGQSCRIGTVKERIQGTPDFIAPEQVKREPLDARTDVFNFGASLYWVLTGKAIPTMLSNHPGGIKLISDLRPTPPEEINKKAPRSLSRLVLDCVAINPADRPSSAKDLLIRLDLIEHTLTTTNRPKAEEL